MTNVANIAIGVSVFATLLILVHRSLFAVVIWLTGMKASIGPKAHNQFSIQVETKGRACRNPLCLSRNPNHARFCRVCGTTSLVNKEAVT